MKKLLKWVGIGILALGVLVALMDGGENETSSGSGSEAPATQAVSEAAPTTPEESEAPAAQVASAEATATPEEEVGSSEPTEAPAPAELPGVGERVEEAGVALTVVTASTTEQLNEFTTAGPGHTYVVLDTVIENTWTDAEPYNPLYFTLRDSEGYDYNAEPYVGDQGLSSGKVFPNEKVRGLVAFEIPADATGLVVTYEPLVIAGGYKPIRIRISE